MSITTNAWRKFLIKKGFNQSDSNLLTGKNTPVSKQSALYDLSELGALVCSGEDATNFLQGQLSNDITFLDNTQTTQLSAYCTPKGRMLALFNIAKHPVDGYILVAPFAVIEQVIGRLQMFVMRAKVTFDHTEQAVVLGASVQDHDLDQFRKDCADNAILPIALAGTTKRYLLVTDADRANALGQSLESKFGFAYYLHWQSLNIHDGLPELHLNLLEELIPQSINLDLVEGVNFKKGCYPGQEIIARIKYRGKPKTRMITASIPGEEKVEIGSPIFIDGRTQSAGMIVNIGANLRGQIPVSITTPVNALEATHYLGEPDGVRFRRLAQAYPIST